MVECRTPEREVGGSKPTAAVLCPWARHFTPRKYWLITQEAVAPSRHDWKIVDWDVKPQHKQTNMITTLALGNSFSYLLFRSQELLDARSLLVRLCYTILFLLSPTLKRLSGHIGLVMSVPASVMLCIRSRMVRDRILKLIFGISIKSEWIRIFRSPVVSYWWAYRIGRFLSSVCVYVCVYVNIFKQLLLRNHWANQIQISYGASMGWWNESLFNWSRSHDQDGRHAYIW